jgi:hypothetical protein
MDNQIRPGEAIFHPSRIFVVGIHDAFGLDEHRVLDVVLDPGLTEDVD